MNENEERSNKVDVRTRVRDHYGSIADSFETTGESGCCGPAESSCGCSSDNAVAALDSQTANIYDTSDVESFPGEVTGLSLGCGDPVTLASLAPGQTVVDLGSGGGIDCFLAGRRVGETGRVIGIDMTAAMIEKARTNKINMDAENVEFRLGEIEHLPVADETADVVISNCVINLSPDKPQVLREAHRVLRPGGRLAVSDIVTEGTLPERIKSNLSAWVGCLAGALNVNEYTAAIAAAGFVDIELTPAYLDESMLTEAMEQLCMAETMASDEPSRDLGLVAGGERKGIPSDQFLNLSTESVRQAVFSAKITARKPPTLPNSE